MATLGAQAIFEYVAAAAAVASAGVSAYSSIQQGKEQANVDKQKATAASLQAQQQQITMRQNMLRALASQNAGTLGAIGTGGASSFGANVNRQLTQGQNDLLVNSANASAQISLLDESASDATTAGELGAGADALGGIAKAAPIFAAAAKGS